MERETGTKLLVRSTRSLKVTEAGRKFYEKSQGLIQQIEDAQKELYGHDNLLTGTIRITAPEDLGAFVISPALARLTILHPMLKFELLYSDRKVDLIKDGFDLAVRIGRISDSGLKLKRAGEVFLIPVASPDYLKTKSKIKTPRDLSEHHCLSLDSEQTSEGWTLRSVDSTVQVSIQSKILCNQMSSLLRMALDNGGVALVPSYICNEYLENGKLVRLLPAWKSLSWPVSIISPFTPSSSARLKVTVDHIIEELKQTKILA